MESELHQYQATILRTLLFNPGARFRDLNQVNITNDHFTFHLKRLIFEGLIVKENAQYYLSSKGKEFANRIDTESLHIEKQAKISVALHVVRQVKGVTQYLMHQRLKEPFFGWYGSHSGKVRWGETPLITAQRELQEETGLEGDFLLKGIVHYHHFFKDGSLLEDKYFWVYKIVNITGRLKEKVEEGENIWMTETEIRKLDKVFASFDQMDEVLNGNNIVYLERKQVIETY